MKSIVAVNTSLPTAENHLEYESEQSLIDYDIVLFNPRFPYYNRIQFSDGGSCVAIDPGRRLRSAMTHWSKEIRIALETGKTVFFLLDTCETEDIATGSTSPRKGQTQYQTTRVCNYDVLPIIVSARNAKGTRCAVLDSKFQELYEKVKLGFEYQVIFDAPNTKVTFTTRDKKSALGGIVKVGELPGSLVLLPYFEIPSDTEEVDNGEEWTEETIRASRSLVSQLIEIDRVLIMETDATPVPEWLKSVDLPSQISEIDASIDRIDLEILQLNESKAKCIEDRGLLLRFTDLLYENGQALENAIEASLKLMGFEVQKLLIGDLEIDHIIVGPSGLRMIGEAEGKDSSAVGITKFRQLESNINEDFDRFEATTPAKGVLFGNGFRLMEPNKRPHPFTEKCITNAKRLGTALVRTPDLYKVTLRLLDNPQDERFKQLCRSALEETVGEIVEFPI